MAVDPSAVSGQFVERAERLTAALVELKRRRGREDELAHLIDFLELLDDRGPRGVTGLEPAAASWMTVGLQYAEMVAGLGEELVRLQTEVTELREQLAESRGGVGPAQPQEELHGR